jgi:hypothetical protein
LVLFRRWPRILSHQLIQNLASEIMLLGWYCCVALFYVFYYYVGMRLCLYRTGPLTVPLSIPQMIYKWIWSIGGMILTGEHRRTRRKTCPSATLSTTNHTWTAREPIRASAVTSRRLTAWAMTLLPYAVSVFLYVFWF